MSKDGLHRLNTEVRSQRVGTNNELSDYEVIEKIKLGHPEFYELIMRRYNQRLYRIARSIVLDDGRAMDAVQEAHLKAYQQLDAFQGERGFAAWLSKIARNEALMVLRKLRPEKLIAIDIHELDRTNGGDMNNQVNRAVQPDCAVENRQLRMQLNQQIDALPEKFRTVFVMRGVEQFSTRETAQVLDLHETTVKTRFFRAKTMLQEQIINDYGASVYEVGGAHCDRIVAYVLQHIDSLYG